MGVSLQGIKRGRVVKSLMKNEHELISIILTIVNEMDPEDLNPGMDDGAPIDEYNQEVQLIYNFVLHNQEEIKLNNKVLSEYINKVWNDNFGGNCKNVLELTSRICNSIF